MDAKTAAQLREIGVLPERLLPGATINGNPIDDYARMKETEKPPKGPNKTERAWSAHLDWLMSIDRVQCYWYEPFRLRLTDPDPQTHRQTFFVPDFMVIMAKEWQCGDFRPRIVEIKGGFVREDAVVKFDLARAAYHPAYRFSMIQKKRLTWNTIRGENWLE